MIATKDGSKLFNKSHRLSVNRRRSKKLLSVAALAAAASGFGIDNYAHGASSTWVKNPGIASQWSDQNNWLNNTIPSNSGDVADFSLVDLSSVNASVFLNLARTVGGMIFGDSVPNTSGGWNLQQNGSDPATLTLASAGLPTITVNNLSSDGIDKFGLAIISTTLSGSQGFTKAGAGSLMIIGTNTNFSGPMTISAGTVRVVLNQNLGAVSQITMTGGTYSINTDASGISGTLNTGNGVFGQSLLVNGTGNLNLTNGNTSLQLSASDTVSNKAITLQNITFTTGFTNRQLNVFEQHGYTLTLGTIGVQDGPGNTANARMNFTGVGSIDVTTNGPGTVTLGAISATGSTAKTLTLGGFGSFGATLVKVNGVVTDSGVGAPLSLVWNGTGTLDLRGVFTYHGSTTIDNGGKILPALGRVLPTGGNVSIINGTLDLSSVGGGTTSSIGSLLMGGSVVTYTTAAGAGVGPSATLTASFINLAGTSLTLGGNFTYNAIPTPTAVPQLYSNGTISSGTLDLGSTARTFTVALNPQVAATAGTLSEILVSSTITTGATGGIIKSGLGELRSTAANLLNGSTMTINGGTFSGVAQNGAGSNALSSGSAQILGGALKLNGAGATTAGAGTIGALSFGDTLPAQLAVTALGATGNTTLTIGSVFGRAPGTQGGLVFVPGSGSLNSQEVFSFTAAPTTTNNIIDPFMVVQTSTANGTLDFGSIVSGKLVRFAGYTNVLGVNNVFDGSTAITSPQSAFAMRVNGGTPVTGSGSLGIGSLNGRSGVILNGSAATGAQINVASLEFGNSEAMLWAGGGTSSSISSAINFQNNMTVGGNQGLNFTGLLNLGNAVRTISADSLGLVNWAGTVTTGTTGGIVKVGGGTLALSNDNTGTYNATTAATISNGTLQIGNGGSIGAMGTGGIVNNAALAINRNAGFTLNNNVSGSGSIYQNGASTLAVSTLSSTLAHTGSTVANNGSFVINATNRLPIAGTLATNGGVSGGVTTLGGFDLAGFSQTVGTLSNGTIGGGVIGNSSALPSVLTVTNGGTYSGIITGNTKVVATTGSGSLVLNAGNNNNVGSTSNFTGGILIQNGMVYLGDGVNGASRGAGAGSIEFNNGTLGMAGAFGPLNQAANTNTGNALFVDTGHVGTILVSNSHTAVTGALTGNGTINLVLPTGFNVYNVAINGAQPQGNVGGNWSAFGGNVNVTSPNGPGTLYYVNEFNANVGRLFPRINLGDNVYFQQSNNPPQGGTKNGFIGELTGTALSHVGGSAVPGRFLNMHIGSLNTDFTYHGSFEDAGPNPSGFNGFGQLRWDKTGTGRMTWTGTGTYTGFTTVSQGTLQISGGGQILNSPTITVSSGATLSVDSSSAIPGNTKVLNVLTGGAFNGSLTPGAGFVQPAGHNFKGGGDVYGSFTTSATGTISPGDLGVNSVGSLTFHNNFTIGGGTSQFDIDGANGVGVVGNGTNDLMVVNGNFNVGTTEKLLLNFLTTPTGTLTFPVIKYTPGAISGLVGGALPVGWTVSSDLRGSFTPIINTTSGIISVTAGNVTVGATTLTWRGSGGNTSWDINTTSNWFAGTGSLSALNYFDLDNVVFDASQDQSNGIVAINVDIRPGTMLVSTPNANDKFTIGGIGHITGAVQIVKNGAGTLELNTTNDFTGGFRINGGSVVDNRLADTINLNPAGSGSIMLMGAGATYYLGDPHNSFGNNTGINLVNDIFVGTGTAPGAGSVTFVTPRADVLEISTGDLLGSGTLNYILGGGLGSPNGHAIPWDNNGNYEGFSGTINFNTGTGAVGTNSTVRIGGTAAGTGSAASPFINNGGSANAFWNFTIPAGLPGQSQSLAPRNAGNVINFGGIADANGSTTLSATTGTFNIGSLNTNSVGSLLAWGGTLSGSTNINKVGTGKLQFSRTNTYTGVTNINGGVLILAPTNDADTATLNGTSTISINNGTFIISANEDDARGNSNVGSIAGATVISTSPTGTFDVSRVFQFSANRFSTPSGVTVAGNGTVLVGSFDNPDNPGAGDYAFYNHSAGTISPAGPLAKDTLTFKGDLQVNGGTLAFDLSNNPAGTNDKIRVRGDGALSPGNVSLGGGSITIAAFNGLGPAASIYNLIQDDAGFVNSSLPTSTIGSITVNNPGAGGNSQWPVFNQTRSSFHFNVHAGSVDLVVDNFGSLGNLKYNAPSSATGTWDVLTTNNWRNLNTGTTSDLFYLGDNVTFDDTPDAGVLTPRTVNIVGNPIPGAITVSSTSAFNYTFQGGGIIGPGALTKSGSSTLTITNANSFTGGTQINSGTIEVRNTNALSGGSVVLSGGVLAGQNPTIASGTAFGVLAANEINIPGGATGTYSYNFNGGTAGTVGGAQQMNGSLTGSGTIVVMNSNVGSVELTNLPTEDFRGDHSAFTGTILFASAGSVNFGTYSAGSPPPNVRLGGSLTGSANAVFDLGNSGGTLQNATADSIGSLAIPIGALKGGANTTFKGFQAGADAVPIEYLIGGKNLATSFDGLVKDGDGSNASIAPTHITKVGSATLTFTHVNTYTGNTTVNSGTMAFTNVYALGTGSLILSGPTARVKISDAASSPSTNNQLASQVSGFAIGVAGETLDITNTALVIDYGNVGDDPVVAVRAALASAFNNANWNGAGITSSNAASVAGKADKTAVGYAEATDIGSPAAFLNQGGIDSSTLFIRYTHYGDTNVDGAVNSADFTNLAANFGASGKSWFQGDSNYDGIVNSLDFNALAANFGKGGPSAGSPTFGSPALGSTVPEPASLGLMAMAGGMLMGRRRRNRK